MCFEIVISQYQIVYPEVIYLTLQLNIFTELIQPDIPFSNLSGLGYPR